MKYYRIGSSFLGLALLISPTVWAGQKVEEVRDMAPDGHLLLENVAGSVEVTGWNQNRLEIKGTLGDDVEELEISELGNGLRVRVRNKQGSHNIDNTDLYIHLPATSSIEIITVSADIEVTDSEGESIALQSVSGDIDVSASPQRLEIESVSGDVEFEGGAPRSSVETVSGDISLEGLDGEVEVSTVSGELSLRTGAVARGHFESVSGDIELDLAVDDNGRLVAQSMSGDVKVILPALQQAEFSAQTFSGRIHSDFGEAGKIAKGPGSRLEFGTGKNGASISLESFSGNISLGHK